MNEDAPVLQVMAGAETGGAEAFFERLVPALQMAGRRQIALTRSAARCDRLRRAGIDARKIAFPVWARMVTRNQIRRVVRESGSGLLVAWMNRAAAALPASFHCGFVSIGRLGGYYPLRHYRHCTFLVGNTPDLHRWMIAGGWPRERCAYLPNFVDETLAPPIDRSLFATPCDAPLLLCLGRLHHNKGFDVALSALAKLPGVFLWIAGTGPEHQSLMRKAHDLGVINRVRFLGWRDDAPRLLASCDLLLCSSRHEPLGNIVLEAWAQRKPVVAARAEGPGQLIEDGITGKLCPIDDADQIALTIRELLGRPSRLAELAEAGHAALHAGWSRASVVGRWLDFFTHVEANR